MSYDLYFLDLKPGQTWEEAIEALEDWTPSEEANASIPPHWNDVVAQARDLLGEVPVFANPPAWEITHEPTAIQLSNFEGQRGMRSPTGPRVTQRPRSWPRHMRLP